MQGELDRVPSYMRGRLTLEKVGHMVNRAGHLITQLDFQLLHARTMASWGGVVNADSLCSHNAHGADTLIPADTDVLSLLLACVLLL